MRPIEAWIRALDLTRIHADQTLFSLLDGLGETYDDRLALLGEHEVLTYRDLVSRVHRYADWGLSHGFAAHTVGLLLHNCPDYVAIWLGLTRIGCTVALLNTNLQRDGLRHCLQVADAHAVIVSAVLAPNLASCDQQLVIWPDDLSEIEYQSDNSLAAIPLPSPHDVALLIYTSGTTGLPKATRITHARIVEWSFWFAGMMGASQDDRLYNCLPMYHSVGGVVAVGSMLVVGGCVVVRERFSASRFWDDIVDTQCTVFQYIGELCRYLISNPLQSNERQHQLRLAVGNGLQAGVWVKFQDRFGVARILEFYAATEGGISLYNCEGKPGAIGRVPAFLAQRFAVALIRCDLETGVPLRNAEGFCQLCDPHEIGEAIGKLGDGRRFDGYSDPAASEHKILRDVFVAGDRYFRTGDLMQRDRQGYYYFVDRMGDTFRWKGENVSTTVVEAVMRGCPGVVDAVVYGVPIAGQEGRAGMAAILTDKTFRLEALTAIAEASLPDYARPLFVRFCRDLDLTGTFKLIKTQLSRDGQTGGCDPVATYQRGTGYQFDHYLHAH